MTKPDTIYIIKPKLLDGYLTYRKGSDEKLIWKTFPTIQSIYWYAIKWEFNTEHLDLCGGD